MNVNIEFGGRGQTVSSIDEVGTTERYFLAGEDVLPPSSVTGIDWIAITVLSSMAMVKAGSQDDLCEIVCHKPDGNVVGNRLKPAVRNFGILALGEMLTLGRPAEQQIIITGRVI